ncbi:hypothetical protein FD755_013991 [Muntiacus reevesi]|uniref:Macrosialin n=1 Tax=Muntiacus reevesi TaxID=9886 RepID=A0A5N3XKA1_MUNRE|nr:hypothetical protein FD755_013991 [Muntiacus reevesi]
MRLAVFFSGALLGLLAGNDHPHKISATLLPSFTVTPTVTESMSSPGTTSHRTTKSHRTTTQRPTTTTTHTPNTTGTISRESPTATHSPATTTSHQNTTVHPTSNKPPPSPSPSPGSKEAIGDYTWNNVLYPTQGGGEAWGISVLNPNRTKAQGGCEGPHSHLLLSFPYGQLSFGFKQDPPQSAVYLNFMAVEVNMSFPQAWTFSVQNSSLQDLQTPLGQSFSCRNASIIVSPALHLDLLSLKLQVARLSPSGAFGPSFSCPSDKSILLPLIIVLILLSLLTLVFVTFCIGRRRPPSYQPL